jgi:tetratricopeptide (TPR) repeat protein
MMIRVLLCVLLGLLPACFLSAQTGAAEARYSQTLDSLRRADNLEEWLYQNLDHAGKEHGGKDDAGENNAGADPARRLSLLSATEASVWRSPRNDPERLAWFYLLANLGYYQLYSGHILQSIDAYERAYRWYFERPLQEADVIEYVLKPLGNNYTRLGDYERAFFIQDKSLAIAISQKDDDAVPSIYNNLAISARWQGRTEAAAAYCRNGLAKVKKNTPLEGLLLSTLADILLQSGKADEAAADAGQAVRILLARKDGIDDNTEYWLMSAYMVQGNLLKKQGNPAAALIAYGKALAVADHYFKGQRIREKAKLKVLTGQTLLDMGRSAAAGTSFDDALSLLLPGFHPVGPYSVPARDMLYGENTLLDALDGKGRIMLSGGDRKAALQSWMLSFTVSRKLRREFYSRADKEQAQQENRRLVDLAMTTAFSLWRETGSAEYAEDMLQVAENSKAQILLDDITESLDRSREKIKDTLFEKEARLIRAIAYYERVEAMGGGADGGDAAMRSAQYELSLVQKQLKEKYPAVEKTLLNDSLSGIQGLLQGLPDSLRLVEFFWGQDEIYVMAADRSGKIEVRRLEGATGLHAEIKEFMDRFFRRGPGTMINEPGKYCQAANRIYRRLCDSIMDVAGKYLLVPDGIIGYLPFDALLTEPVSVARAERWPYLIRKATISYAYSLQAWRLQSQEKTAQPPEKSLAGGDSSGRFAGFFLSYDSGLRAPIPAVVKEYKDIRRQVKGEFYTEHEATREQFNRSLERADIVHVSAHSFLESGNELPALEFSNGKFFLFELYGQAVRPRLVVLSACRTGDGVLSEGEGIISLARGFTGSGAGGIVAGLWNMNDEATASLMAKFYRGLETGEAPATALRAAKLEWLDEAQENALMKLPYYWAGSVYAGNNGPVEIDSARSGMPRYFWIFAVVGGCLLIYSLRVLTARGRRTQNTRQ